MTEIISGMKGMEILEAPVTLKSTLAPGQDAELEALAKVLAASVKGEEVVEEAPALSARSAALFTSRTPCLTTSSAPSAAVPPVISNP